MYVFMSLCIVGVVDPPISKSPTIETQEEGKGEGGGGGEGDGCENPDKPVQPEEQEMGEKKEAGSGDINSLQSTFAEQETSEEEKPPEEKVQEEEKKMEEKEGGEGEEMDTSTVANIGKSSLWSNVTTSIIVLSSRVQ